jgi:CubicO group peptidase (beta-lactamase class C family)
MRRLLLVVFVLVTGFAYAQKTKAERLDSLFSALNAAGTFNGNVLIAENGVPIFERSYGFANFTSGEKLDERSVFELASVSKQFTAAAIMLLQRAGKLTYDDEIARWIRETTDDALQVEDRALYVSLHRMEQRGWIESEWGFSENNRKAKYYQLTSDGRRQLRAKTTTWTLYAEAVFKVLQTA